MRVAVSSLLFGLVACVAWSIAGAADVYRSIDSQGNVVYSDRPTDNGAEIVTINVDQIARSQPPATVRQPVAGDSEPASDSDAGPLSDEIAGQASAALSAEQRARNCEIARERNARYEISRRLYRELPNGEREYLDDAEIDAAKAQAAADVGEWCD